MKFAVVVSRFNPEVTNGLLEGAKAYLKEKGTPVDAADIYHAPGAFELPLIAQTLIKSRRYSGVVCLGCVIKGDTAHFEFISLGATIGIMQTSLSTETPVSFGVLTTYTDEQAEIRSQPGAANKGREAAAAVYETAELLSSIRTR
jgi:6,7-dimethyl-8-ribityllumazine synthase